MFETSHNRSKTKRKFKIERTVILISTVLERRFFCGRTYYTTVVEAEFLDVIGTKVLRVFFHAFHSHLYRIPPPPHLSKQKWFETGL
jgi:hypothetical protein